MHGDEIKGTELSSAFDMQLEIKFIDNAPLTMFDEGTAGHATVPENRKGGRVIDCFGARRIAIR